jgi:hypothetical protein
MLEKCAVWLHCVKTVTPHVKSDGGASAASATEHAADAANTVTANTTERLVTN